MIEKPKDHLPDWMDFDYSGYFSKAWKNLGFSDDDLRDLEQALFDHPSLAPVEPGTGGLRKIRIARPGMGKRGGARVGYAHFPKYRVILVVTVFAKNDLATLSPRQKTAVKQMLETYEKHLERIRTMSRKRAQEWRTILAEERRRTGQN